MLHKNKGAYRYTDMTLQVSLIKNNVPILKNVM
jgi:hypothetical protein